MRRVHQRDEESHFTQASFIKSRQGNYPESEKRVFHVLVRRYSINNRTQDSISDAGMCFLQVGCDDTDRHGNPCRPELERLTCRLTAFSGWKM